MNMTLTTPRPICTDTSKGNTAMRHRESEFNLDFLIYTQAELDIQSGSNTRGHELKAEQCGMTLTTPHQLYSDSRN